MRDALALVGDCRAIPLPDESVDAVEYYRDADWLMAAYIEHDLTLSEIADLLGCDRSTVGKWRKKLDIPEKTKRVDLTCPVCGDGFQRTPSQLRQAKHASVCSRECHYRGRGLGVIGREVDGGYDVSRTELETDCAWCGETIHYYKGQDRKYCDRPCYEAHKSVKMRGENNWAWQGGTSYEKRCWRGHDWPKVRKQVYERDGYTCQECGRKCISRRDYNGENGDRIIQCHHVGGFDPDEGNDPEHLVTLCARCHAIVEARDA